MVNLFSFTAVKIAHRIFGGRPLQLIIAIIILIIIQDTISIIIIVFLIWNPIIVYILHPIIIVISIVIILNAIIIIIVIFCIRNVIIIRIFFINIFLGSYINEGKRQQKQPKTYC